MYTNKIINNMEKFCFLCFNSSCMCVNDSDLQQKIYKYLQLVIHKTGAVLLCSHCVESIERFHDFYERIHHVHSEKLIKTSACENQKVEEPLLLRTKVSENISDESEYLENSSDSNFSLSPHKRKSKKQSNPKKRKQKVKGIENELNEFYKDVVCPKCNDGITHSSLNVLRLHFESCHEESPFVKCCNKQFLLNDLFRLRSHLKIHADPDSCKCDVCGKILSSPRHMRLHKDLHKPDEERTLECRYCGRKCSGNHELYRHIRSIHLPQDSVCEICGKEFRKYVTFRVHMKTHHKDDIKDLVCEVCAKTYKAVSSLQSHMLAAHSKTYVPKTKDCPQCGKRMGAIYLKKHLLRIHGKERPHKCPVCDKVFKLKSDIRSHLVVHTDQRPYPCTRCSSTFKTKATLKMHLLLHAGGNPINCPYCSKQISSMANFLAHRRRMHNAEHERYRTESRGLSPSMDANDEEITHSSA